MSATKSPTLAGAVSLAAFGLAVGHASDEDGGTGLTVVRGIDGPFRAAAAVVGRATGTRELDTLHPAHLVDRVDAILLTGGSAFGLDAAGGVMRWCESRGRGFAVGVGVVPIVPAAVIFDLAPIGRPDRRPTAGMAYEAADGATPGPVAEGSVGAGTGATVGKGLGPAGAMKGGVGCAVAGDPDAGLAVAALVVVNAFGDVRDSAGRIIAGARSPDGGWADTAAVVRAAGATSRFGLAGHNTTLAVVAVNAPLSRLRLAQLATAATAAFYRRITPAGTTVDGDVLFAVSPLDPPAAGAAPLPGDGLAVGRLPEDPLALAAAEGLAVEALERAIERAVRLARGRDGIPGLADTSTVAADGMVDSDRRDEG
ncbi:MAG: P1 family peptidase [Gemmatimonadaceae bacterium]